MTKKIAESLIRDRLHARQQELRKRSGLPHPDYYKELGKSYDIKDDQERYAHQAALKKKYGMKEDTILDESMKDHIEQTLANQDINAKVEGTKVHVHPDNVAKTRRLVAKMGLTHTVHGSMKEAAWGQDKMANLKAAHDRHSEKAIAANKAGDHEAVKVHQSKMNMIKTQMNKLRTEEAELEEAKSDIKDVVKKAITKIHGPGEVSFKKTSNGGHFVHHENDYGDLHSHQYDPKTGKVEKNPHTVSYYNEDVELDEGYSENDIANGGTVIYKKDGKHHVGKVSHKTGGGAGTKIHTVSKDVVPLHHVVSTDFSDWNHFKNKPVNEEVQMDEELNLNTIHLAPTAGRGTEYHSQHQFKGALDAKGIRTKKVKHNDGKTYYYKGDKVHAKWDGLGGKGYVYGGHTEVKEDTQLDEISAETKASYVGKAREQVAALRPFTKKGEYRDLAKNLVAKRMRGIAKANEEKDPFDPVKGRADPATGMHKMLDKQKQVSATQEPIKGAQKTFAKIREEYPPKVEKNYYKGLKLHFARGNRGGKSSSSKGGASAAVGSDHSSAGGGAGGNGGAGGDGGNGA